MAGVLAFMDSPLVTWLGTFNQSGETLDFQELSDGAFLNDVFLQIDERDAEQSENIKRVARDANARIHNWNLLLNNMLNYYQEVLEQVVVLPLPDVVAMVKDPLKDESLEQMGHVLLLLLGCAVQCDHKERYINAIKGLQVAVQQAMVTHIQQVTDDPETVFNLTTGEELDVSPPTLAHIIKRLANERHALNQRVVLLSAECQYLRAEVEGHHGSLTPPQSLEGYQLTKDLTHCRNQVNKLTEQLEEKQKQMVEMREELDQTKASLNKIKQENLGLSREAKLARSYRDEIDEYKEEAGKVERYEKELAKYKDKMQELDFYKTRVEELRQDNDSLVEARARLEEQVTSAQRRSESVMDELVRSQLQVEDLAQEREELSLRLQGLVDENTALELSQSQLKDGAAGSRIRRMLSYTSTEFLHGSHLQLPSPPTGNTISDELRDSMSSQVTRLEAENDQLRSEVTEVKDKLQDTERELERLQGESQREIQKKMSELELQTKELRKKTSRELSKEFESKVLEIEQRSLNLKQRVSQEFQQRVSQLEQRNRELSAQTQEYQKQLVLTQEAWCRDKDQCCHVEKMNKELIEEREQFKARIGEMRENSESRIKQLERKVDVLQGRASELEAQNAHMVQLCGSENAQYMAVVAASPQTKQQQHQNQPEMGPARISYVNPNSPHKEVQRRQRSSSTTSQDGFRSPMPIQRHASVIGIPAEPRQTGRRTQHHHHHYHHYHHHHGASAPTTPVKSLPPGHKNSIAAPPDPRAVPFSRSDRLRSSGQHRASPRPDPNAPFMRNAPHRASMPERRSSVHGMMPERERRLSSSSTSSQMSQQSLVVEVDDRPHPTRNGFCPRHGPHSNNPQHPSSRQPNGYHYPSEPHYPPETDRERTLSSDIDSGCATSPDSPASPENLGEPRSRANNGGKPNSWEMYSTETTSIQTQIRMISHGTVNEKWKVFVDKIMELQNKNQNLVLENSEIKRALNSVRLSAERIDALESKNLHLEVENRKLKRICESLQMSLTGKEPYDKRLYHFYSNV